ncbi:MAG: alpha/beta hydrolase [Oleispira sp.]|nr:alpha/beta hydrolase [Oleispira sp.]MBL4882708.1 alpha/beta hydrolase [Oleispira sp.]
MTLLFISLGIFIFSACYYFARVAKKPALIYQATPFNKSIINTTSALTKRYYATPWLFNTHMQLIALGFIKGFAKPLKYDRHDVLTMEDGGEVAVDWLGLDLAENTPTMLVLHTISGNPQSMRGFVRYMREKLGWRVALCVRRGHGEMGLKSANFNTMGNTLDLDAQIQHIQNCFPQSALYATGISAGSGVLASYLGKKGTDTPIKAAVAYCPAYDMRNAFTRAVPFYSKMMTKKLHKLFIQPNEETFQHLESLPALKNTQDLHEFHQHLYEIAGHKSAEDYMQNSNPSVVFDQIKIPLLILNAEDDPICHIENVYQNQHRIEAMDNIILVLTQRGSHCAYFEGITAKPWANRLIKEYFTSVASIQN